MAELGMEMNGIMSGTTDAVHVPFVVCTAKWGTKLAPGGWVKFKEGSKWSEVVPCEREEAIGIVDPFLEDLFLCDRFAVLLVPGVTTPVRHSFEINPELKKIRRADLEAEMERLQKEDPGCADCYEIRNNQVIRM